MINRYLFFHPWSRKASRRTLKNIGQPEFFLNLRHDQLSITVMRIRIVFIFICLLLMNNYLIAQEEEDSYQYLLSVLPDMNRKIAANEIMISEDEKYLIVNYGNRPTFIVVYSFNEWKQVAAFRTTDWVDFSGAYVDQATDQLYIKESRYSTNYHRLDIKTGKQDIIPCDLTPDGCPVIESRKAVKALFSEDRKYYVAISRQNVREVKVYIYKNHISDTILPK